MQFGSIKLKVDPPAKFTGGTKDNYEDFEKRLRTYLSLIDTRFPRLKWAVRQGMPITSEIVNTYLTTEGISQEQRDVIQDSDEPFRVLHAGFAD